MALTVGELVAYITLDDSAMAPGLRRTEQAMQRSGQRLGQDADRSGQQAGQQLGQGLVRGADGQWRDMRGNLVDAVTAAAAEAEAQAHRAGQRVGDGVTSGMRGLPGDAQRIGSQAGDDLGDGLADSGEQGADGAVGGMAEKLGKLKTAAIGIGAAAGAYLMDAMGQAMEQGKITGRLGAQLGATGPEAQRYGHVAGQLYASAVTEDFQGAADVISAVMRAGIAPPDATEAQLQSIATKVSDLASTFELDLGQTANAVGQMIKTGLAKNGTEAVDALTAGLQKMGPRADDIADTFNEYSTIFRQMGISATDATGLLSQGMKAGARDTDVVADSLKEFVLITQGGGAEVDKAFAKIGLSGSEMQKAFVEGGPKAKAALDKVFDGLRNMKDGTDKNNTALTLFGTKSEDTQKALMALDPSSAASALGEVGGAADRMGDSLRDNASTRVEQFKRGIQQNVVDFLGTKVIPAVTTFKDYVGRTLGGLWDEAGKSNPAAADRIIAFFGLLGDRLKQKMREMAPKIVSGLSDAGAKAAAYISANPEQTLKLSLIASAIIVGIAMLPLLVAGAIATSATLMMVGFTRKLIDKTNENIPRWWNAFKGWVVKKAGEAPGVFNSVGQAIGRWFSGLWARYISGPVSRQWNSLLSSVRGLPGRSVSALNPLGGSLAGVSSRSWQRFKDAAASKGASFISWVRGLPGRARSALGSIGSTLYGSGRALIRGFVSGIMSMIGSVRSAASNIVSAARDYFPFSPAKTGPFSGRGYTSYSGRALIAGFQSGIADQAPALHAQMRNLMDDIPGLPSPSVSGAYAGGAGTGSGSASNSAHSYRVVRIGSDGTALGDLIMRELRKKIAVLGGDVQFVLGAGVRP